MVVYGYDDPRAWSKDQARDAWVSVSAKRAHSFSPDHQANLCEALFNALQQIDELKEKLREKEADLDECMGKRPVEYLE